jgi:hypothetical protein
MWGSGECYAALTILGALGDQLGIEHRPFIVGREIDRNAVSDLFFALSQVERDELRGAARRQWKAFFGVALPELTLIAR